MEITVQKATTATPEFLYGRYSPIKARHEEGTIFALPSGAHSFGLCVWEGPCRHSGSHSGTQTRRVNLKRAQATIVDRGGCRWESVAPRKPRQRDSARGLVPIPRMARCPESSTRNHPREKSQILFAIPLRPTPTRPKLLAILSINFELRSAQDLANSKRGQDLPAPVHREYAHSVRATFEGENVNLTEDFVAAFDYRTNQEVTPLAVIHAQKSASAQASPTETAPVQSTNEPGFFAGSPVRSRSEQTNAAKEKPPQAEPQTKNRADFCSNIAFDARGKARTELSGADSASRPETGRQLQSDSLQ